MTTLLGLLVLLLFGLFYGVIGVILAVAALGIGTVLSWFFAVTVWEATILVVVITGVIAWLLLVWLPVPPPVDELEELDDEIEESQPVLYLTPLTPPRRRTSKKRPRR